MAMSKIKALQIWCKRTLEGYRDVAITDMTTSWRNGLAFCAMIHKYRPDLIDYDSLDKENVYDNNKLAFDVAEKELSIAALLEASDMVAMKVPDRLSVITYVAQYHNYFKDKPILGGPGMSVANKASGVKRHHEGGEPPSRPEVKRFTPSHENKQDKSQEKPKPQRVASMGETCQICRNKVYLLERHIEDGKLYHRSCYRHSDLSPTSKVYARPSLLSSREDKKGKNYEKDMEINGMTPLGNGFGPSSRQKSPERKPPRFSLNKVIGSEEPEQKNKVKLNGSSWNSDESKTKSVIDKFERTENSDWKSKRSESPKAEGRSYPSSADRPSDLPLLHGHSENAVKDKWPPVKTDKFSSKPTDDISAKSTPVPRPRQSIAKDVHKSEAVEKKSSRSENRMEVDDKTVSKSISSTSLALKNDKQPQRPSPRKLPLVLQSQGKDTDNDAETEKFSKRKIPDTSEPSPKPRMFLKKHEKNTFGSTEKLNKTMDDRIKDSKERNNVRQENENQTDEKRDKIEKDFKTPPRLISSSSEDPLSPPPLPRSTPPDISQSAPSPPLKNTIPPPRPPKIVSPELVPAPKAMSGPPKPPRGPTHAIKSLSPEPMDEDIINKAREGTSAEEPVAVMVYPGSESAEKADEQVLGGLLKSLANVRQRQPETSHMQTHVNETKSTTFLPSKSKASRSITTTTTITTVTRNKTDSNVLTNNIKNSNTKVLKNDDDSNTQRYLLKSKPTEKLEPETIVDTTPIPAWQKEIARRKVEKDSKSKSRPKPSSTLLDYQKGKELNLDSEESHSKAQKGQQVDTTSTPEWQKGVKSHKNRPARPARPKSMEVLSDGEGGFEIGEDNLRVLKLKKEKKTKEIRKGKPSANSSKESIPDLHESAQKRTEDKTGKDKKGKSPSSQKMEEIVPDWQKDAQKRMEARKGNFVDPEKRPNGTDKKSETQLSNGANDNKLKSNITSGRNNMKVNGDHKADQLERNVLKKKYETHGKKVLVEEHELDSAGKHKPEKQDDNKGVKKTGRTKVSPGIRFNFDDNSSLERSVELSPKHESRKKGRQPPPRPRSPPPVNRALKHNISTPNKHTPPRIGISPNKLTPMQIQRQLIDIDSKLTDLELKGRRLEDSIRNAQEDEEDTLMIDWFLLVSEKNELVRQEADLIYAARENELEDEQESVKDQLRNLLEKPNKTKEDKQEEEFLLGKLLDIVHQRDRIVESIDDDKHRYEEEDREIAIVLEKKAFGSNSPGE